MIVVFLLLSMIGSLYVYEDIKDELISVTSAVFTMLGVQEDTQLSSSGMTLNYCRGSVPSYFRTHYSRYP